MEPKYKIDGLVALRKENWTKELLNNAIHLILKNDFTEDSMVSIFNNVHDHLSRKIIGIRKGIDIDIAYKSRHLRDDGSFDYLLENYYRQDNWVKEEDLIDIQEKLKTAMLDIENIYDKVCKLYWKNVPDEKVENKIISVEDDSIQLELE